MPYLISPKPVNVSVTAPKCVTPYSFVITLRKKMKFHYMIILSKKMIT